MSEFTNCFSMRTYPHTSGNDTLEWFTCMDCGAVFSKHPIPTVQPGRIYRTPYEPSGLMRVTEIERPIEPFYEPTAFGYFVGDHPAGYKDGSPARYYVKELAGREENDTTP